MELHTKQQLVDMTVNNARANLPYYRHPVNPSGQKALGIYNAVLAIENPTVDSLIAAGIRPSEFDIRCDNCGNMVEVRVQIGEESDYESWTARVCADCLRKALALIEGETK